MSAAKNRAGAVMPSRPGTAETAETAETPETVDPGGPDDAPYIVTPTGDRVPLAQYLAEGK